MQPKLDSDPFICPTRDSHPASAKRRVRRDHAPDSDSRISVPPHAPASRGPEVEALPKVILDVPPEPVKPKKNALAIVLFFALIGVVAGVGSLTLLFQ
jgi:hypothetical protein